MNNDEKMTSRDDETLPANGDEQHPLQNTSEDQPSEAAPEQDGRGPQAGKTFMFPSAKIRSAEPRLDASFGMPDLAFLAERRAEDNNPDAEYAAQDSSEFLELNSASKVAGLSLQDGTGWESGGSIARPSSLRARIERQEADDTFTGGLFANDDDLNDPVSADSKAGMSARHEANVTPFPGTVLYRHADSAPADLLRGGAKSADIFGEISARANEDQGAASLEVSAVQDTLADAVQSALRNVYGGHSEAEDANADELDGYTVAEALAGTEPALDEKSWPDQPFAGDWRASRAADYEAEPRASDAPNTEAVLDYLYSQRRQERAASYVPKELSLNDFAAKDSLDEDWQEDTGVDDQARRVSLFPERERGGDTYRGRGPDLQPSASPEASIIRGGYYPDDAVRPALNSEWGQAPYATPQNTRGAITPSFAPALAAQGDQLQVQGPDSGHLLGAAGLGLIGGIALAGVLAVFVFNSFVDESGQTIGDPGTKVVERLVPAQTTGSPAEPRPAPEIRAVQPAAPVLPPVAPPVEAPNAMPAAELQRSAALDPAEPQRPADTRAKPNLAASAVSGAPDTPIKLNIALSDPNIGDALISLKGLPKEAKLSTGIDVGGGQWLLPPGRLKDVTITAPGTAAGNYQLEAQLLKDDAQTSISDPVPFKLSIAAPAGARPAPSPAVAPAPVSAPQATGAAVSRVRPEASRLAALPDEAPQPDTDFLTQMLIRDGNKKMREGDIAAARRFYEQATASGNPEAALAMGRSFDPTYFEKLTVKTGKPDPATAFDWYKKALDGGLVTARVKIDTLKQWLQR